jgi:hypothetical protein
MSVDRRSLLRIRLTSILALFLVMAVSAQADDTWHNVYHSLKRFFTGKPSATPIVHHRRRHTEEDGEKSTPSTEPSPSPGENEASPGASATPRVVILPASSPTAEGTPGAGNSVRAPDAAAKPEPSPEAAKSTPTPELGPVLRSLSGPTPMSSPGVIPSPAPGVIPSPTPGAGRTATN